MNIATADTRRRAIEAYQQGKGTQAEIAYSYRINIRTFQRWLSRFRESGETSPRKRGHRQALFRGKALTHLNKLVERHPDATLNELKTMSGVDGSIMAVKRALDRLGYRYKKKRSTPANKSVKMLS